VLLSSCSFFRPDPVRCREQISDKERELEFATLFKDVAGVLADKCINPDTQRPYTLSMIERALRDVHFSVDPKRGAKQQALQARPSAQLPWCCVQLSMQHAPHATVRLGANIQSRQG